ncbi:hypothetical protein C0J52_05093 [Blattella germanica]|nr:hypothetical protein C0J52_05093 [Blattella germanica]
MGYSAVALPLLGLNEEDGTWFASIASIATPFGCLMAGPILDAIGRRYMILLVNIPFILGWLVLCLSPDDAPLWLLFIGRILTGLGTGMASLPATVYIAEMATARMRPMLVTLPSMFISGGILLVYLFGYVIQNWRWVAAVNLVAHLSSIVIIFLFLRESPTWLVGKQRVEDAGKSLMWVRGEREMTPEVKEELESVCANVRALGESLTTMERLKHAGVTIDPFLGAVLLGVFQLICNLGASYALNRCGRRPMSLISGTFMTFCMVGLGLYLQLAEDTDLSWVPLVLIMVFIGPSGGITTCLSYSWSFAATKLHPGGYAEVFYFYGCASAVATVYLLLFLPETFGKTLHQIGEDFKKPGTGLNCCQRKKEISLVT